MAVGTVAISPEELGRRMRAGETLELIDVRTRAEFREVHAAGARNVPLDQLCGDVVEELRQRAVHVPLYMICQAGQRAQQASEKIAAQGEVNCLCVEGGTRAWIEAGLPVVRGKKMISLERQVRIAAGSLVLIGALLAWFAHPAFVWLSAFIGGGLLFAGVTDTCGMAMLLAKMPWNRK